MHVKTRRKELVEKLYALGLSASFGRVLRLSTDLCNAVCERYEENGTVCPPNLRGQVFTTADNIDVNPSFTTTTGSFHGTGISLIQHQVPLKKAIVWGTHDVTGSHRLKSVSIRYLQINYTTPQVLCPRAAS